MSLDQEYQSPDYGYESPYQKALREGGQTAADDLLKASTEYYTKYPSGHPDGDNPVNWNDPESYSWLYNTPGERVPEESTTPPPSVPPPTPPPQPPPPDPNNVPPPNNNNNPSGVKSWVSSAGGGGDRYREQQDNLIAEAMKAQTALFQQMMSEQAAREAERKARADSLYGQLHQRATQSLNIDPNDSVIKSQVDAYAAQQERARRDYISDMAEREGPLANLRGERRMASEGLGHAVGGLRAELMGRELTARRNEIANSLAGMAGMLSGDQESSLRQQLGLLDSAIAQQQIGLQRDLGFGDLDLRRELGFGDLDLRRLLADRQNDQFYSGLGSEEDRFAADLGFRNWDRRNFYDLERSRY